MLDKERRSVIDALRKLTGEDGIYKVVEADEILEIVGKGAEMTKQRLSGIIRDLRDLEYIKVKYFTSDEYCLLTLKHVEDIPQMHEEVAAKEAAVKGNTPAALDSVTAAGKPGKKAKKNAGAGTVVPSASSKGIKQIFLAALLGASLGGGIVAAITVLLMKFL